MKNFISILLALVMCLSLAACGGGNDTPKQDATEPSVQETIEATAEAPAYTKESLLENPIYATVMEMQTAVYDNRLKAKQTYCNVPIVVTGTVLTIEDDFAILCDSQVCVDVYLSIDELVELSTGTEISVVGVISDIEDKDMEWGTMTFNHPHYIMDIAFVVE